MKFQFMKERSKEFPIGKMAEVLQVTVNGYYSYVRRKSSLKEETNTLLMSAIEKIYREGRSMYGSPRIHGKLSKLGIRCSRRRVAKLMKKRGLTAKMRKSWKRTTKPGKREAAKNLVRQEFKVVSPNHTWVLDISVP